MVELDDVILCRGKYYKYNNNPLNASNGCVIEIERDYVEDRIGKLILDETDIDIDKCLNNMAHTHSSLVDSYESCHWKLSHALLKKPPKTSDELKILIANIFCNMNFAMFDENLNIIEIPCNFKIAECGKYVYHDTSEIYTFGINYQNSLSKVHRYITNELFQNKRINKFL
jgi:hypothetical protein